jgi:putative ABC transport system permease protein
MSLLDALRHRLRPLLGRRAFDRDMDEEFRHHLELHAQEFPDSEDPTARARARFGSPAFYMEETRRMTSLGWLDALGRDFRYACRSLGRTPAFTAVAVLSLAIGIGANSAIFGLTYSLLFQPLPLPHPEQLVELRRTGPASADDRFPYDQYQSLRGTPGFTSLTAFGGAGYVPIVAGGIRSLVGVDAVDGNFFLTIGLEPLRGRLIGPADERARAPVAVISEDLWVDLFNRADSAVGSAIRLRGAAFTVIGVAPRSFQGLGYPGSFQLAVPLSTLALVDDAPGGMAGVDSVMVQVVGRLADPAGAPAVGGVMNAVYQACCAQPAAAGSGVTLAGIEHGIPFSKFDVADMFGRVLFELMGGAAVVLLAACANLATLLLARAAARERELAVRRSLGASRGRLAAQMLVESGILATLGALAGLVLAAGALRVIAHNLPGPVVDRAGLQLNGAVLGFTAAVAVASVVLFGAVPAWRATRGSLATALKESGQTSGARREGWLDRSVVVAQVALALVLLNAAGLFVATLRNLRAVDGGFATSHTVTTGLDVRGTAYEGLGVIPVADRLLARAAEVPGVQSAALAASVPVFGGRRIDEHISVEGYTPARDEAMDTWFNPVSPGYFATLGIGLRAGRGFTQDDRAAGQRVAVVNEAFVRQYVRDRNPIGLTIRSVAGADTLLLQVVGVAADAHYADLRQPAPPMVYVPLAQFALTATPRPLPVLNLTVRTAGDDRAMPALLRNSVLAEAPELRASGPEAIEASLDAALNRETLTARMATLFGAVALILAAIGLYGTVSYHVAQRTREIGVRMALGSSPADVVWLILRRALALVAIGLVVGVPIAFGGGKVMAAELFGLAGQSPYFTLGAGVLLLGVALAASALPARRAAQVDPLIALRAD